MGFTMREYDEGAVTTIRLAGELDMSSAPGLKVRIDELITAGQHRIVLDLAELTFCDSAGLNTFILGDRHCQPHGGWLRLVHPNGHVARVIALSGIDEALAYRGAEQPGAGPAGVEQAATAE